MNPRKRTKLSDGSDQHSVSDISNSQAEISSASSIASSDEVEDETIRNLKPQKSRQTKRRKLRATAPPAFGSTLQSLLSTDAPSSLPLSLKSSAHKHYNERKLESKANRLLQVERKEKEDTAHIQDAIGGWGAESERTLRKVAQRGVVKLFNMIQSAQSDPSIPSEKPALSNTSRLKKDNILGRGKEATRDNFFDIIKSGGLVSTG